MWGTVTAVFALACVATPIVIEVVRSVVHRRREQRDGLGGTQDIALWGPGMRPACLGGSLVLWLVRRKPYRDKPF